MSTNPLGQYKPMQVPPTFWYLVRRRALAESTTEITVTIIDVLNDITEREAKRDGLTVGDLLKGLEAARGKVPA